MKTKDINKLNTSKMKMKWVNFLILGIFILVFAPFVNATLPDVKAGECITIKTILNTSSVNISTISYPNQTIAISNKLMLKTAQTFTYEFCDTNELGNYVYDYFDDEGKVYVNDFNVTSTGTDGSNLYIILLTCLAIIFFLASLIVPEEFFVYISGTLFLVGGIYLMINGLNVINNTNTRYLAYVYIGIGLLFTIGAYIYNLYSENSEEEY